MSLNGASILITGGCGQVGYAIIERLQEGHPTATITVLDLVLPTPEHARFINGITYFACDITNQAHVREIFEIVKPLVVFHTAGLIPSIAKRVKLDSEKGFEGVNLGGTRNVLEASKAVECVKAFVFTSSCDVVKGASWLDLVNVNESLRIPKEFGDYYSKSKALAETATLSSSSTSLPTTALRSHAVFSAHDDNLLPLILKAPRNIHLGPGTNLYDFTYAPNLADAHILAAKNLLDVSPAELANPASAAGKAFFVTNDEPLPFQTFLSMVWTVSDAARAAALAAMKDDDATKSRLDEASTKETPQQSKGTTISTGIAKPLVWLSEKVARIIGKEPVLSYNDLGDSVSQRWFDNSAAKKVLGYVPEISIAMGLEETMARMREVARKGGIT